MQKAKQSDGVCASTRVGLGQNHVLQCPHTTQHYTVGLFEDQNDQPSSDAADLMSRVYRRPLFVDHRHRLATALTTALPPAPALDTRSAVPTVAVPSPFPA